MSWPDYISNLMKSGHLTNAAICGLDGSVWATSSPSFQPSVPEVQNVVKGFGKAETLHGGFNISGQKYFYLRSDDIQIQGKQGVNGASLAKSKQCVIIGTYGEKQQPGNARDTIEKMRTYLYDNNF